MARRTGLGLMVAAVALLVTAPAAFAPHVAQLQVSATQVRPGQEVTVFGPRGYGRTNKVEVRWNAIDGPVLGSFQPNEELYAQWGPGAVTIPADAGPGTYTIFATQILAPTEAHIRGVPSRTVVQVVGDGGAPVVGAPLAPVEERPAGLVRTESTGIGKMALIAIGTAGLAVFVAGATALAASRRPRPEAAGRP